MSARYYCENRNRLERVALHPTLNGIDFLDVLDAEAPPGSPRQQTLLVHFARTLPGTFTERNVRIEAKPRAAQVGVVWARRASDAAVLRAEGRISVAERDFLLAAEPSLPQRGQPCPLLVAEQMGEQQLGDEAVPSAVGLE